MSRPFTSRSSLENLKKEAKRWLKALRADDPEARARFLRANPQAPETPCLRDVQHALAREHGLDGWSALLSLFHSSSPAAQPTLQQYREMAEALLDAYRTGAPAALERHWKHTWHRRNWLVLRTYVQLDLGRRPDAAYDDVDVSLADAQFLIAREHGFESWQALTEYVASLPIETGMLAAKPVKLFSTEEMRPGQLVLRDRDWSTVIGLMREREIPALHAEGQMNDAILQRISELDHVTALDLSGSKELTDSGLRHLAQLPRLRHLDVSGTGITDAGLNVLQQLTKLRFINVSRTAVTDAGAAHLSHCESLEWVNLSGTPSGDGAIQALTGKPNLGHFRSGNRVTDGGLALLHGFPAFKTWHGGEPEYSLMSFEARPTYLLLRGELTDVGIASLVGLDGLFALNLDDEKLDITAAGLEPLTTLSHLGWFAFDATDESMPRIARMPELRFLMCQDTAAGDDGFAALSRSRTIEMIWGRRCHNLRSRGFAALASMPVLKSLSVSCKNVEDAALSALPRFPALQELMPMDIPDEGYRHIGRCRRLEALILMYCRDTTDVATEQITGLPGLKKYFASYNRITDRTPELLSEVTSLEDVEFSGCAALTNHGIARLARLPHLRELRAGGMPAVTADVITAFPARVHVEIEI